MITDINNTISQHKTILLDGEVQEFVELSDGKILRVKGGTVIFYQNEDHFLKNEKLVDHLSGCMVFNFAQIKI